MSVLLSLYIALYWKKIKRALIWGCIANVISNYHTRFFEWNRRSKHKQPYFIHLADPRPSPEMLEVLTSETSEPEGQQLENIQGFSEVVKGRMLAMAGLFDIWNGAESVSTVWGYISFKDAFDVFCGNC